MIGNNIANANTVGFKSGAAQFADMYANSVATAVSNQVGIGTQARRSAAAVLAGHDHHDQPGARRRDQRQRLLPAVEQRHDGVLAQRRVPARQERLHHQRARPAADGLRREQLDGIINTAQTVPLSVPTANIAPQATTKIIAGLNLNAQDPLMLGTPAVTPTLAAGSTLTTPRRDHHEHRFGHEQRQLHRQLHEPDDLHGHRHHARHDDCRSDVHGRHGDLARQRPDHHVQRRAGDRRQRRGRADARWRSTRTARRRTTTRPARRCTTRSAARRRSTCTSPRRRRVRGTCTPAPRRAPRNWSATRTSTRRARCSARGRSIVGAADHHAVCLQLLDPDYRRFVDAAEV